MSQNSSPGQHGNRGDGDLRRRFTHNMSDEQAEIQDWLNANGQLVLVGIVLFVVVFAIVSAVTGG